MSLSKIEKRNKIKKRIRQHVFGNESRPRLSVFRSNKEIYAQIVDDVSGKTLASASSRDKDIVDTKKTKIELSKLVGISIGSKAIKAGVSKIGFDRNGYLYHGRVKSLAEGAREAGLKF
jgi:large subunit ribosomal protein L18